VKNERGNGNGEWRLCFSGKDIKALWRDLGYGIVRCALECGGR
jgi:hypothetical protein